MPTEIRCPHCLYARELPDDRVPSGTARVTCPKCRESFIFSPEKDAAEARPAHDATRPEETEAEPDGRAVVAGDKMTPRPEQPQALRSISDLFKDTWELYLGRVGMLMGLYLLSLAMLFIPPAVLVLAGGVMSLPFPELRLPLLVAGGLTGGVLGSVAMLWGFAGMIAAVVDRSLDFQTALRRGWERLWGFAWVTGLCAYVVIGGFFLFIVPGLLFLAWSFFAQFIFFEENRSGMDALMRSRCYVRRRLGGVLLRLLAVWGVSLLLGAIPMVGGLLSFLFYPFLLIYSFLLYRDLRSTADLSDLRTVENGKLLWLVLATLGYLLLPGVLLIAWGGTIVAQLINLLHP